MALEPVRLVTYQRGGTTSIGIVDDDAVWDIPDCHAAALADGRGGKGPSFLPAAMRSFIALGDAGVDAAISAATHVKEQGRARWLGRVLRTPLAETRLLPPVPDPEKILCMGLIFPTHAVATGQQMAKSPQIFMKPTSALVGNMEDIVIPKVWPERTASGAELCVVIGRPAKGVREEDALDCVYGYTAFNDVTARGLSFPKNKIFDSFAPTGPWIVPRAYAPDPQNVTLTVRVNGKDHEVVHTSDMVFSVAAQIRDCAEAMTLKPGDYIATGDVGSEAWLRPGDLVECVVAGIGTIANRCVAES
ncbi:hypothetical protein STAQ_43300 [Allostella sp. ATCC 35155]|nr:hypothetical protein STAQ_43300 [Stella sp. ATCC 35155]